MGVKRFIHIFTIVVTFLSTSTVVMATNGYDTDLLKAMAIAMGVDHRLETLSDGCYYRHILYSNRPVTVEIQQGNVTHIGYSLFTQTQKDFLKSPVCNFLERYSLEIALPLQCEKSVARQLEEDGIFFRQGSFDSFRQIEQDTSYQIKIENLNDKRYTASWSKDGNEFLAINFPIEHELLAGCNMIERERRLIEGVRNTEPDSQRKPPLDDNTALQPSWQGKYYILQGDTYYLAQLNSNKYYVENKEGRDGAYQLLYDSDFVAESLANLFTTVEIPNDYKMELRVRKYGLKEDTIYVSLNQWTAFCLKEGCVPYFGIAKSEKDVECEIVMRNKGMGYCHVVRAVIDSENLEDRHGLIKARVVPYVPTSRIKYLFDELKL